MHIVIQEVHLVGPPASVVTHQINDHLRRYRPVHRCWIEINWLGNPLFILEDQIDSVSNRNHFKAAVFINAFYHC